MTFREALDADFEEILTGDFSVRIIIIPSQNPSLEFETRGIFDDTEEVVAVTDGGNIMGRVPRVTLWQKGLDYTILQKDIVRVDFEDGTALQNYVVREPDYNSEGQVLLMLKRTNEQI